MEEDFPRHQFVFRRGEQGVSKGGFAGAVWAHDGVDFALINGDGEAAENLCFAFHRLGVEVVNPEQFGHGVKCIQGFGN